MVKIHESIENLLKLVNECSECEGLAPKNRLLNEKEIGLKYVNLVPPINIMFIAESPPKEGFFYDDKCGNNRFRDKLFCLINKAGLEPVSSLADFNQKCYYMADAINCRWDKTKGTYLSKKIFENCSVFLARQIKLFRPYFIVAIGKKAKLSLQLEEVKEAINNIPQSNIVCMQFILGRGQNMTETDDQKIEKLRLLNKRKLRLTSCEDKE